MNLQLCVCTAAAANFNILFIFFKCGMEVGHGRLSPPYLLIETHTHTTLYRY